MCGFSGVLNLDGAPVAAESIAAMNAALRHRGPDGEGQFIDGCIGLGHRRLAIVDVAGGQQPMRVDDVVLVANAEIYNHRELRGELEAEGHVFRSDCDVEAILHGYRAWGPAVVDRLVGMFAFAVWDAGRRRMLLARDRFGQKPLYYSQSDLRLVFASEPKAILAAVPEAPAVEPAALARYLLLDYTPAPWSIYLGIQRLPAAHSMLVEHGAISQRRYWSLPVVSPEVDVDSSVRALRKEMRRSVSMRLMSDDPVGVFLSGATTRALSSSRRRAPAPIRHRLVSRLASTIPMEASTRLPPPRDRRWQQAVATT